MNIIKINSFSAFRIFGIVIFWLSFLLMFLWVSCFPTSYTVSNRNIYTIYNPATSSLHPWLALYHFDDTSSLLVVELDASELLFNQANAENRLTAQIKIHYNLFPSYGSLQLLDSGSETFTIYQQDAKSNLTFWLKIPSTELHTALLEVRVIDVQKKRSTINYLQIDRTRASHPQYFGLYESDRMIPYTRRFFVKDESIRIQYSSGKKPILTASWSPHINQLALPPFSSSAPDSINFKFDSTWTLIDYDKLHLDKEGVYFFHLHSITEQGLTLFNFGTSFPAVRTSQKLLEPLRYLSSSEEYNDLLNNPIKKVAVDEFWLKAAGNQSRAKELIRIFYTRVQLTNIYFTSYKEGWQTDRGMIYIIFGAPASVYKTENSERWVYGENMSFTPVEFIFVKRINPYCDNDFILRRNIAYRTTWYTAIDAWRDGQVFSLEK